MHEELRGSVRLFARSNSSQLIASCARPSPPAAPTVRGAPAAGAAGGGAAAERADDAEEILRRAGEGHRHGAPGGVVARPSRIGLSKFASVKVATAVSELARNIVFYAGSGYIVTNSHPVSTAELYRVLLHEYGRRALVPKLPASLARFLGLLVLGDRVESLVGNAAYDGSRFRRDFGWSPKTDYSTAIALTVGIS